MMPNNQNSLLAKFTKEYYGSGLRPRSDSARIWFMSRMQSARITPKQVMAGNSPTADSLLGSMFFFGYDAKFKEELPYWDKFPLVVPMEFYPDSFLGINFHYLGYMERAILLDKLNAASQNRKIDESTRLKITYDTVRNASRFREVKPCIKKYLYSHVKSRFVHVEPKEWEVAIFLPVQRFVGAKAEDIWEGNV
jgi:hypothetical protein